MGGNGQIRDRASGSAGELSGGMSGAPVFFCYASIAVRSSCVNDLTWEAAWLPYSATSFM